ncbi:hypothetical protein OG800_06710 [Streptomyces sp. NBC_00445]|uniref:hypothetical protein n=1 Tax=unclassified Streptomyces TaxID=2593676 RepID=UPI002E1F35ED|nr:MULTISPECIES: hypothetical protein [unclassified Streptomyces]
MGLHRPAVVVEHREAGFELDASFLGAVLTGQTRDGLSQVSDDDHLWKSQSLPTDLGDLAEHAEDRTVREGCVTQLVGVENKEG